MTGFRNENDHFDHDHFDHMVFESFLRFFIHFIGENEWLYIRLV